MATSNDVRETQQRAHPRPVTYVGVAVVLTVVTIIELWLYYTNIARVVLVLALLALSAGKFSLVVLFYMHLRYDSRLFAAFFVGGLTLAAAILLALLALFGVV